MVNIRGDLQFIVGSYKCFFSGESFKSGYKHQNWHEYYLWVTFLEKTLADQNVKMAAISQDGRHFEYQYIRF